MEAEVFTSKDDPETLDLRGGSSRGKSGKKGNGFIGGIILIWIGIPLVWMNERRDVKTYEMIQKARKAVRRADAQSPVEGHNWFLVHASARATSQFPATDPAFGVVKNDTVKVKREVEVYQWVEK